MATLQGLRGMQLLAAVNVSDEPGIKAGRNPTLH